MAALQNINTAYVSTDNWAERVTIFERHQKDFENRWPFELENGLALKRAGQYAAARQHLAAVVPLLKQVDTDARQNIQAEVEGQIYDCFMQLKEYPACEVWLKDHPVTQLVDLYLQSG